MQSNQAEAIDDADRLVARIKALIVDEFKAGRVTQPAAVLVAAAMLTARSQFSAHGVEIEEETSREYAELTQSILDFADAEATRRLKVENQVMRKKATA
jgi:hypothetical protein